MKRFVLTTAFAAIGAIAAANAQTPTQQPTPRPSEPQATAPSQAETGTTKLFGCVYRERDVPGRSPNVAEQAGVLEDYILADASMTNEPSSATPSTTPGATGTSGTAHKMYKLERIPDEQLKAMVGKRVEVTGKIDAEAGDARKPAGTAGTTPQPDKSVGPDQINLPEFEVTSIRETTGSCPAKPSSAK